MRDLTERERMYLQKMPSWSDVSGQKIISLFDQLRHEYEFDSTIPIEDLREHVRSLEAEVERLHRENMELRSQKMSRLDIW